MSNTTVNGFYGQRMSTPLESSLDVDVDFVLAEMPISLQTDASSLVLQCEAWRRCLGSHELIPALILEASILDLESRFDWSTTTSVLKNNGVSKMAFLIDEDNPIFRQLSPRLADEKSRNALTQRISKAIETISKKMDCLVSMTVEELCPGGFDPTEGIKLAQLLANSGACGIIGSGGSVDFPMLKHRRPTRHKPDRDLDLAHWPETWMTSALWLLDAVQVPVFAQGQFENGSKVRLEASKLGFAGVVNLYVKDPSAL